MRKGGPSDQAQRAQEREGGRTLGTTVETLDTATVERLALTGRAVSGDRRREEGGGREGDKGLHDGETGGVQTSVGGGSTTSRCAGC